MFQKQFVRIALRTLLAATAGTFFAFLAGCPGTLTDEEKKMFQGGACADVPALLTAKCGTGSCHAGSMPAGNLDLASSGVEARVTGVPGTAACNGAILANPLDPSGSLLHAKLTDAPPCGSKMPIGASLSDEEIDCISAWIGGLEGSGAGGMGGMGMGGAGGMGGMGMGGAGGIGGAGP